MGIRKPIVKPLQKVKLIETPCNQLSLFAICSSENGYRLSWLLNTSLSLNLQRHKQTNDELPAHISLLDAFSEEKNNGALLLSNKMEPTKHICQKYKEFDYLLAFRQPIDVQSFELTIKRTPGVVAAIQVTHLDKKILDLVNLF